ncbi:11006_t:CDS:2 [Racocetra fulgida]|uniref:11006_t:CDS:1 n=1 Tax=Racocetra fulgida TaxID=60492 RepID=A0A9N9CE66_9GLOM|nr:11006_t:CDS:2 [Racocetra fulgida]
MDAAEESFVKSLKLNYGFRYENRKFVSSRSILDGGELTLEKYTGEPLIYQRTQDDTKTSKTAWELFEEKFSTFIETQKILDKKSKISDHDVLLLIPILEVTYLGKPDTFFQSFLKGEFLFEKVLVGGVLVIKNVSVHPDDSLNQLKARITWAINEFRWGHENLFKDSKIDSGLLSIEDFIVIAYEKVKPSYACLDAMKWQEIGTAESCPEYFDKRLVPGISAYHIEISMKDWLGSNNTYMQIPNWIKHFKLEHVVEQAQENTSKNKVTVSDENRLIHHQLLQVLISANVPFAFVENEEEVEANIQNFIDDSKFLTLSEDGWTNVSKHSLVNFIITNEKYQSQIWKISDFSNQYHTGIAIFNAYKEVKKSLGNK